MLRSCGLVALKTAGLVVLSSCVCGYVRRRGSAKLRITSLRRLTN